MTTAEIEQMAMAAGFGAVVHEGEVIVSGEEGPLAVVSPVPGSANGIRVCVPAMLETGLRDRIARAFAPKPEEPPREVSIVLSSPAVPAPGRSRFAPAELLNAAPSPRQRLAKTAWTAPLKSIQPVTRRADTFRRLRSLPAARRRVAPT
jgi:hypothetical protein